MTPEKTLVLRSLTEALNEGGLHDVCGRCKLRLAGIKDSREHRTILQVNFTYFFLALNYFN